MKRAYPEVTEKTDAEVKEAVYLIKTSNLPDWVKFLAEKSIELARWLPIELESKRFSLKRLRVLLFGKGYGKSSSKKSETSDGNSDEGVSDSSEEEKTKSENPKSPDIKTPDKAESDSELDCDKAKPKKGHGRMPHTVYKNASEVSLSSGYNWGDFCPTKCGGKLGKYTPGVLIRIRGQSFSDVTRYKLIKLRCNLCGYIVSSEITESIGYEKYDATFKTAYSHQIDH